jgi:hypothetical protein
MTSIHAQLVGAAMTPSPAWRQRGSRRFPEVTLKSHDPCSGESVIDRGFGAISEQLLGHFWHLNHLPASASRSHQVRCPHGWSAFEYIQVARAIGDRGQPEFNAIRIRSKRADQRLPNSPNGRYLHHAIRNFRTLGQHPEVGPRPYAFRARRAREHAEPHCSPAIFSPTLSRPSGLFSEGNRTACKRASHYYCCARKRKVRHSHS